MAYYKDMREHIEALEAKGKLVRIKREINKDTELMPLVRWQYRGLSEKERKAFFFENVTDVKGRKYNGSVLIAAHAGSRDIYAASMMCEPEEIQQKWVKAQDNPIEPKMVSSGVCQEEVHIGQGLLEHGGLAEFPVPLSTPGFDNAPYFSAPFWVTKDPETGIRNVGAYRAMVKAPDRLGLRLEHAQHLRQHWDKCREKGIPLQAALTVGTIPIVGLAAVTKFAYNADEFAIAGGIAGEPLELVKCKTVDIEVPATAEIIIEGEFPTDSLEREGCFGEYSGYLLGCDPMPYLNVTCITHRKNPIYTGFISQFPPSESTKLKVTAGNAALYRMLKEHHGIDVVDVAFHEESGAMLFLAVSIRNAHPAQAWQVLKIADAYSVGLGKIIVVVDEDIDPRDLDSVMWAMCFRMQPHRDVLIVPGKVAGLDPSAAPKGEKVPPGYVSMPTSAMLIDATRKWPYPPISLPAQEFMEKAKKIWEEEGLPPLKPKAPWYGRSLGDWPKNFQEEAELALKGEHYQTGEKLAREERTSI